MPRNVRPRSSARFLAAGTAGVALVALARGPNAASEVAQTIADSSYASAAKFSVAFPLTYHFLGAARHAVRPPARRPSFAAPSYRQARAPRAQIWDLTARGFTNQNMLHSSYALFGGARLPLAPRPHPHHAKTPRAPPAPDQRCGRAGVSGLVSLALASYSIASPEDKKKKA